TTSRSAPRRGRSAPCSGSSSLGRLPGQWPSGSSSHSRRVACRSAQRRRRRARRQPLPRATGALTSAGSAAPAMVLTRPVWRLPQRLHISRSCTRYGPYAGLGAPLADAGIPARDGGGMCHTLTPGHHDSAIRQAYRVARVVVGAPLRLVVGPDCAVLGEARLPELVDLFLEGLGDVGTELSRSPAALDERRASGLGLDGRVAAGVDVALEPPGAD